VVDVEEVVVDCRVAVFALFSVVVAVGDDTLLSSSSLRFESVADCASVFCSASPEDVVVVVVVETAAG